MSGDWMAHRLDVAYLGCFNSPRSIFGISSGRKFFYHWKGNILNIHSLQSGTAFPSQSCKPDQTGTANCESLVPCLDNRVTAVCACIHLPTCMTLQQSLKYPHQNNLMVSKFRSLLSGHSRSQAASQVWLSTAACAWYRCDNVQFRDPRRTLVSSDPERNSSFYWMMLSTIMLK